MSSYSEAVLAIDEGRIPELEGLLRRQPGLLEERCCEGSWYDKGYFRGAMLLHHVAGNPIRRPLAGNVVDAARLLLAHGADANAATAGGETTIGLLLTSQQASDAGVAVTLIELLRANGARDEYLSGSALTAALANQAPATATELIAKGASLDLRHAAGLGRLDDLARLIGEQAELREEALLLACMRGEPEAARVLLEAGARGDVLVALAGEPVRTALHEAANRGYEDLVHLLLARGATTAVVEPRFHGTAAGWARHGGHAGIADYLASRIQEA